jgi:hypothetical protein
MRNDIASDVALERHTVRENPDLALARINPIADQHRGDLDPPADRLLLRQIERKWARFAASEAQ